MNTLGRLIHNWLYPSHPCLIHFFNMASSPESWLPYFENLLLCPMLCLASNTSGGIYNLLPCNENHHLHFSYWLIKSIVSYWCHLFVFSMFRYNILSSLCNCDFLIHSLSIFLCFLFDNFLVSSVYSLLLFFYIILSFIFCLNVFYLHPIQHSDLWVCCGMTSFLLSGELGLIQCVSAGNSIFEL